MKAISALNPSKSLVEMPKVRWKRRKYSKDLPFCKERTLRWMLLCLIAVEQKVTRTCPIRQSEKMIEKLNRLSCLVKFCWFGIIAQAGRVKFTAVKLEDINPSSWWAVWYILPSFNGHFLNIWNIGSVKFELKHPQFVAYSTLKKNRIWFWEFYCSN